MTDHMTAVLVQVSVWDDERRHLRGPACDSCQSSSPAETFMFSFKDISIQLSRGKCFPYVISPLSSDDLYDAHLHLPALCAAV